MRSEEKGNNTPIVIGLTGPNAAGKGEAAAALRARSFACHSLSDVVRQEAVRRGRSTGRDDLILTGNELRRERGPGVLAELTVPKLGVRDLVDSIRNPSEVEVLRHVQGFVLLGVTASPDVRFARATRRQGRGDALSSLEAFLAKEAEENSSDPAAQRLSATFALADLVVVNDGTIQDLRDKIGAVLLGLEGEAAG